jgi:hypothetical protein
MRVEADSRVCRCAAASLFQSEAMPTSKASCMCVYIDIDVDISANSDARSTAVLPSASCHFDDHITC